MCSGHHVASHQTHVAGAHVYLLKYFSRMNFPERGKKVLLVLIKTNSTRLMDYNWWWLMNLFTKQLYRLSLEKCLEI